VANAWDAVFAAVDIGVSVSGHGVKVEVERLVGGRFVTPEKSALQPDSQGSSATSKKRFVIHGGSSKRSPDNNRLLYHLLK
jgi:hypothetical protein